jgi:hypothetical protein
VAYSDRTADNHGEATVMIVDVVGLTLKIGLGCRRKTKW